MSDENDKTRIKSALDKSAASETDANDKTRIAAKGKSPLDPDIEMKRRLLAQRKARELEKRLAAMAKNKSSDSGISGGGNGAAGNPAGSNSAEASPQDKTRLQRRMPDVAPAVTPQNDKTRIQSPMAANRGAPADATRIQAQHPLRPEAAPDKTVFQPRAPAPPKHSGAGDSTTLNELTAAATLSRDALAGANSTGTVNHQNDAKQKSVESEEENSTQELLKGRFLFEQILGAGGMGVVYKAKDMLKVEAQDRDPYVAIKVLGEEFKAHPEAFIALQRESRKTQRIAHPNIVNVYDFDRDGDTVFMTMEYLEGKPLDKLISQYRATGLPEEDVWTILEGISAALIYAHAQKIIHSDFKPGNIFVTANGNPKVFDFGIARAVAKAEAFEESTDDRTVFDAGNLGALTPAYASLEMLEGETPDIRDDIYALGCIAYEMFTGNHPFNRVHANEAKRQKLKLKRIPNISKRQWKVIEKSLAFDREDRVATVDEFWRELTRKSSSKVLITGVATLLLAAVTLLVYQNYFAPKVNDFSEDEIRSEIERDLLIGQYKRQITDLLASPEFSVTWEKNLHEAFQVLGRWLGPEDAWLIGNTSLTYLAYIAELKALIAQDDFARARVIHKNALRYATEEAELSALMAEIEAAELRYAARIEEEKRAQSLAVIQKQQTALQAEQQKEKTKGFDVAMETVNKQLECRSTMNMRDIDIAISKLRQLDPGRYTKAENTIVQRLALCITKVGSSFPERGEEFKKRALRIFPNNSTVASIKISPKDPCDLALAGLGARGNRAVCRDSLDNEGESFGKGPPLVVIPAKGSMRAFAMGKYEVTREDLNRFCAANPACAVMDADNDKLPAINIELSLIKRYLDWLSETSKRQYRLPTKAEWIYAARAGSSKLDSNRNCRLDSRGIKKGGTLIKATTGQQNNWGLVNYLGNAQELVDDGNGVSAAGGSFDTAIEECVETRQIKHSGTADAFTGFRVVREID